MDQIQTLNEWLSRKYNYAFFCRKISIYSVFDKHDLVKTRFIHPEKICPPKSATRKVFPFSASVVVVVVVVVVAVAVA